MIDQDARIKKSQEEMQKYACDIYILEYGLSEKKEFYTIEEMNDFIFKNKIEVYTSYKKKSNQINLKRGFKL